MEEEEKKESEEHPRKKSNFTEKIRENPWMLSSFVLGILVIILLFTTFSGGLTGNVTKEKAADNLVSYAQLQGVEVLVNGVKEEGGLYNLDVEIDGKATHLYVTKDGKNLVNGLIPIAISSSTETQTTEVPKSDKPSVELYVFTYCPFGTQAEKGIIPAIKLLGDKIDFKIRQIGAMHGEYEKIEAKRQLCIEKNYPDKFLDYVLAFAEDTSCQNGATTCVPTKVNALYAKLGIDASKINSCMASEGDALYDAEVANANGKGIGGSPTLVINGVEIPTSSDYNYYVFNDQKIPFARDAETYKGIICSLFSTAPSECSQELSTASPSAGFGSGTSSGSSSVQCAT